MDLFPREPAGILELANSPGRTAGARPGAKTDHDRGRKRPRLGGIVAGADNWDSGFLHHFARHGILEALARLHEAGDRRVTPRRPHRLPAEERALSVGDQHDDRRIQPREVLLRTTLLGAAHAVPPALGQRGRSTCTTVALARPPDRERPRVGEEARFLASEER